MKTSALLVKVMLAIAIVLLLGHPVLGYQIQFCDFELGIEARPGYHTLHGIALSPNEENLYAAHWQSGTVQVEDPIGIYTANCPISLIGVFPDDQLLVGGCVGGVIVSGDGCCVYGTRYYGGRVHSFDVCNGNTETILNLDQGWANMLWKTPNNSRAIVSYNASGGQPSTHHHLALIDISGDNCSMSVLDTLNLERPGADRSVAFLPDSSMMYFVVNSSTTEGAVLLEISLNGSISVNRKSEVLAGEPNQETRLRGVVLAGDTLYVGDHDNMKIHIVDKLSFNKTGEIPLPNEPNNIALHPDGQHLFILSGTETECSKISVLDLDIQTKPEVGSIDCTQGLRKSPLYITFTSDGSEAYVAHGDRDEGGVSVLLLSDEISTDSDGDGIPDDEDSCPQSNLDPTVIIDGCDSEVDNVLFDDGCTMSDLISECGDAAWNHGKFVSCVSHLTNDWKKEGLISGKQKGAIQRCAARSDIPTTTTTTSIPSECISDEECSDGLFCNGDETCDVESGICQTGTDPCPDDGLFCNGEESCDEGSDTCKHSGNPCKPVLTCDEDDDVCVGCSTDEDCDDGLYCNGAETCDIGSTICQTGTDPCQEDEICSEETDECVPESEIPIIELIPNSAWRSHLLPLSLVMVITGNNTNFNATTTVGFSGDEVLPPWHMVLSPTSILVLSLITPSDSEDTDSAEVIVTVISTVDTDEEVATAAFTLNVIPGF